jgi:hypothetical protein
MTGRELIYAAARVAGVRKLDSDQLDEGLIALNTMIDFFGAEVLMLLALTREEFTLVQGTRTYTIGSGATFNTVRPKRIRTATLRDSGDQDYTLDIVGIKDYSEVQLKTTETRPGRLFYHAEYATGTIYFDYEPDAAYTLILWSFKNATQVATLDTEISFPVEYEKLIKYNLGVELAPEYGAEPSKTITRIARETKDALIGEHASAVPTLSCDRAIVRRLEQSF